MTGRESVYRFDVRRLRRLGDHLADGRLRKPDLPCDRRRPETGFGGGQNQALLSERHDRAVRGIGFRSLRGRRTWLPRPESVRSRRLFAGAASAPADFRAHGFLQAVELLIVQQAQRASEIGRQGKPRHIRRAVGTRCAGPRIRRPPSFSPIIPIPGHVPTPCPCDPVPSVRAPARSSPLRGRKVEMPLDTNLRHEGTSFTMTVSLPGSRAGMSVSATVKWYDPAKGYGFLVPGDGSPDLFCRAQVLAAVGLDILLAGAAVACETAPGLRGPEVSRILSVDFSAAAPRAAAPARVPGNEWGPARHGVGSAGPAASGSPVRAFVKWFQPGKGYGFLEREDGAADLFCHLGPVLASGHDTLPEGAAVTCEVMQGDRGPQVSRILSVEPLAAIPGPAEPGGFPGARSPGQQAGSSSSPVTELTGAVKFFDPARGFGFVLPDAGGPEVFVHASVLFRSGMTDLSPGQRVIVSAERVPRGLQATAIEPI